MKFIIRGGKKLSGSVAVMGAKNSALKVLAAPYLFRTPITVTNMPQIEDVSRMAELLATLGVSAERRAPRAMRVDASAARSTEIDKEIGERLRASVVLTGPMLARLGRVRFPHPGGCVIGKRPIDVFLNGFRAFGANVREIPGGYYEASAKRIKGCDFTFRVASHTGTETLMMLAALAHGKTILRNAACDPEIPALAEFLNRSGARIEGAGTPTMTISGTGGRLLSAKAPFRVIPDRIEAGSFLMLGAALGKKLTIRDCVPEHLATLIAALREAGVPVRTGSDWISVMRPAAIRSVDMKTRDYPGFATDLQAPFTVLMTQARGQSMIFETVFDGRLNYIEELNRMGANIVMCDPHRILVHGPTPLRGRDIESPDLRAGLAFVIAALIAKGGSVVRNVYQIDRGYERIDERLRSLGADIARAE